MLLIVLTCASILEASPGCTLHAHVLWQAKTPQQCSIAAHQVAAEHAAEYRGRVTKLTCRARKSV